MDGFTAEGGWFGCWEATQSEWIGYCSDDLGGFISAWWPALEGHKDTCARLEATEWAVLPLIRLRPILNAWAPAAEVGICLNKGSVREIVFDVILLIFDLFGYLVRL